MPGLFGKAKSLFNDEVEQWKRSFSLLGGIPKTFKNNPRNAETMDAVFGLGGIVPGVGDVSSAIEAKYRYDQGDKLGAGLAGIGALPLVPNVAGMFIGKGAKTWDQAKATEAAKRLYRNEDPAKVWAETGIGKAPWDRTLRAEIPDKNTYFSDKGMDGLFGENKFMRVSDAIDHPQLKKAYNMDNKAMLFEHNGVGNGSYGNGVVAVNADINDPYSVAAHELQHSIQHDEGWARGGSPNKVLGEARSMNIDPTEAYRRLAGEAEARLTQYRLPLSAEERLAQYPYDPEYFLKATGVPLDSLIVRYGDGPAMSTGRPRNHLGQEIPPTKYEQALEEARIDAWKNHGLPENNTAMDRARAMGYEDSFHGTRDDIRSIDLGKLGTQTRAKSAKEAFFSAADPETAGSYAINLPHSYFQKAEKKAEEYYKKSRSHFDEESKYLRPLIDDAYNSKPAFSNAPDSKYAAWKNKYEPLFAKDRDLTRRMQDDYESYFRKNIMPLRDMAWENGSNIMPLMVRTDGFLNRDFPQGFRDKSYYEIIKDAKSKGIPGVKLTNTTDAVGLGENAPVTDIYATIDPSRIRSRFAAFNMSKRDSPDLLAGFAPYAMPVGAGLLGSMYLLPREDMQ